MIFEQGVNGVEHDAGGRSRFAELRFLANQLDTSLPAQAQASLIGKIKNLLEDL